MSETLRELIDGLEDVYYHETLYQDIVKLKGDMLSALTDLEAYAALGHKVVDMRCGETLVHVWDDTWARGFGHVERYDTAFELFGLPAPQNVPNATGK